MCNAVRNLIKALNLLKIVVIFLVFILPACSPAKLYLVPDENQFSPLADEEYSEFVAGIKGSHIKGESGSIIYTIKLRSPVHSALFEQALVFARDNDSNTMIRTSVYSSNFSRLLYYAVLNNAIGLTCDAINGEAVFSSNGLFYLPDLPELLHDPKLFLSVLLGRLPDNLDKIILKIQKTDTTSEQVAKKVILKASLPGLAIESLYENISGYGSLWHPVRLLVLPDKTSGNSGNAENSKSMQEARSILIEYSYTSESELLSGRFIPSNIMITLPEDRASLEFIVRRFSDKIEGSFDQLFDTTPPASYRVISIDK
ncbi:MAG TPA: hypothetical protein PKA63_02915 [Oligoflexia bacterium]|nr:hypothetical protein [Oligoflexia bacterium]HMP47605.1 hypothetical protein [Oligoflexia bacterium]